MIITLVIASGGIYFGCTLIAKLYWWYIFVLLLLFTDQFLKAHLPSQDEQYVYRGEFIVTRGDFIPVASDASGLSFVQTEKAKFYQLKLDQIFSSSALSKSFLFNEILHLEAEDGKVKVHFNIHMSTPKGGRITADDIYDILRQHIESRDPAVSFLAEIEIDPKSLIIEGVGFCLMVSKVMLKILFLM